MKHLKLFEHFRTAFREAGIPVEPEFEEVVVGKKYLFLTMYNGDDWMFIPEMKMCDTLVEAHKEFIDMKKAQNDIKMSNSISDERPIDYVFMMDYEQWYGETEEGLEVTEEDFNGNSMRIIVDDIDTKKYYVVYLKPTELVYDLYKFDSKEESENYYNDMVEEIEEDGDSGFHFVELIINGEIKK